MPALLLADVNVSPVSQLSTHLSKNFRVQRGVGVDTTLCETLFYIAVSG
jgi:hypothetical protein